MTQTITVQDLTSPGTFTPKQLFNLWWSLRYQALFHFNRSPWVEHGYCDAVGDVELIPTGGTVPDGAWNIQLLDTSDQQGALGYHEDQTHTSTAHSTRGLAAATELPLAKVFCRTSREDKVEPSEVASHEMLEMLVDPYVMDESKIRKYLSPTKEWYIGEVGDPVQNEGYDVGEPEGRPCNAPEAIVANFAYPAWWGVPQNKPEFDFLKTRKAAFELAPGGYMSVAPENNPTGWTQIYGSDRPKAEAAAHAYERAGDIG